MPDTPVEIKKAPAPQRTPANPWQSFRNEIDRLFDRFDGGFSMMPAFRSMFDATPFFGQSSSFEFNLPAVDVAEDAEAFKITAELPGLDEKDVEVSLSGDRLVLKGEKRQEKEEKDKNHYLSERCYGAFERSFLLPDGVDRDKLAANFAKGVLTVTLPKTAEAQNKEKKIEVKAA